MSARADCPVPPYLPPPGLQFTGFCFLSPPAEVWRLPPKAAGERLAGDFQAVPRFLLAEPQPVSASVGRALDVSPRGAGPAVVLIARRWRGPGRRLAPATGSEQGGAREAHPGDVAGARRAGLGLLVVDGGSAGGAARSLSAVWKQLASGCASAARFLLGQPGGRASLQAVATSAPFLLPERAARGERPGLVPSLDPGALEGRGGEGPGAGTTSAAKEGRRIAVWPAPPDTRALAEVVVCAVGRVVTLPAVEITAQATALLVLVMLGAAEDNGWESPLFSGRGGGPEPLPAATAETVSLTFSGREERIAGGEPPGTFLKLGRGPSRWACSSLLKE